MNSPTVSIVIVNYNGGLLLQECLTAVFNNSDVDFEVIIVDNASTDGSVNDLRQNYPQVRLVQSNTNLGYAKGVNLGVSHAHGLYLVILNMDVIVRRNWLSPLINFLKDYPKVGAVAPCIMLYGHPGRINALGQNIHVTGLGFNRKLNYPVEMVDPGPIQVSGLHGGTFAMRVETFHQLRGMNEIYFMYHEDVEISLRLTLAGYRIYTVPASVVYHKYALHMTPEKLHWLERHRWLTILATYRTSTLLMLVPFLLLTEILMAVYCLSRGISFVKAKQQAMSWVFSHWSELRESRRKSQTIRRVSDWQIMSSLRWSYDYGQFLTLTRQRGGWLYEVVSSMFARWAHDRAS